MSMSSRPITDIDSIGPVYAEKLKQYGVFTTVDLLKKAGSRKGRLELRDKLEVNERHILGWLCLAELFRINGVGPEYAHLLEQAGVDTAPELAMRNPQSLHAKMVEVNEEKQLVRRLPSLEDVQRWVKEAQRLPRVVEY